MTKIEQIMNQLYETEGLTMEEQITITNGLPLEEAKEEYVKLLLALNEAVE